MCNVDEDSNTNAVPIDRGNKITKGNKCVKCDEQGILITRVHDSFCKECFRVYVVHKFRSAIGKSRLIRDGEKVLVAFSGGANSAALLHLISDGLSLRAHKRLRFIPSLLHIDEYSILEECDSSRKEVQKKVSELMIQTGFEAFITSLEQGLDIDYHLSNEASISVIPKPFYWKASTNISDLHEPSAQDVKQLKGILSNLSSMTCKEDFLRNFRSQLIVIMARKLGFDKVLTAECSSRLSVRILSDIAQGRGSQVSLDTGFSDCRNDDVMFIRPIRDLTSKEVVMYNNIFDVQSIFLPTFTTKAVTGASIERLTESFVVGLQADFPSTTSNIVRTSEKLSQSMDVDREKCAFCKSSLDTDVGAASALNAILFSKKLSLNGRNCVESADDSDLAQGGNAVDYSLPSSSGSTASWLLQLCFGCRLMVQDFGGDPDTLPLISKEKNHQSQMDSLKDQISEFILEDES